MAGPETRTRRKGGKGTSRTALIVLNQDSRTGEGRENDGSSIVFDPTELRCYRMRELCGVVRLGDNALINSGAPQ